jgi:hypothetical protein
MLNVAIHDTSTSAFAWGTVPHEQALRSFAEEVLPTVADRIAPVAQGEKERDHERLASDYAERYGRRP